MREWFKTWFNSPYYHLLYRHRNHDEAQLFVENLIAFFKLDDKSTLLDLACGKGRHALAFSKFNLDVTGLDLSQNSIDYAMQYEHDKLHFYVHDMRKVFRTSYFDIVCNLFTSFGYFKTKHDNELAAKAMFHAIKPGGKILIDFVNKNFATAAIAKKPFEEIEIENVHYTIRKELTETQFLKSISIKDKTCEHTFHESLNSFTLSEMQAIFVKAGCKFVEVFGNYQLEPYHEVDSPRMIVIFEK